MDDHRLLQIALDQGLVTAEQVAHAERERQTYADRGLDHSAWDLLQDLGYITEERAKSLRKSLSSNAIKALEVASYTIQGRLGQGGMGDVFRGRNAAGQEVAVKLLSSRFHANQEYRRRFDREARASIRLHHEHIARSLEAGVAHGQPYMLMELVEGPSLKTRIHASGPIDQDEALCLLEQMGAALGYAWKEGVLHRDVKPANILLGPPRPGRNEPFCAKLIDFGLAKVWQDGTDHAAEDSIGGLTGAGLALGTPHYMSPEQASGQADLDQRCDIYGLGASLYHALMGHTMYSGKSSAVIMYKQVTEQIDLSELRKKGTKKQLVDLIGRMLAKDRGKRIATWDEVAAATTRVRALAGAGLGEGSRPNAPPVSRAITDAVAQHNAVPRQPRRWTVTAGIILGAMVLLGIAGAVAIGSAITPTTPQTIADSLRHVTTGGPRELHLEPGMFPPLRLGAAHAGLILRGAPGTVIAALSADPSLDLILDGITISGPMSIAPGATVRCRNGSRLGSVAVDGGTLELESCTVDGPLTVAHRGQLVARTTAMSAGLAIEDSSASIDGSLLNGGTRVIRAALRLRGGSVGGGLNLDRATAVELRECRISGDPVAITAAGSVLSRCEQVTIGAQRLAIAWAGPTDPSWTWRDITVDAPTAASGLSPALTGLLSNTHTAR